MSSVPPDERGRTFHDSSASGNTHKGTHAAGSHSGRTVHGQKKTVNKRWSYVMQDIPMHMRRTLNDINHGYAARLSVVAVTILGVGSVLYYGLLVPSQERKPLARRWNLFSPVVPITLIEKSREEQSNMYVYRFALPNSYDYAGYEPVSSVQMISGKIRGLSSLRRWYTPISHPEERGVISFAIKNCDPGRMSARLRGLEIGDVVYLGRWMKEFPYKKNAHPELGLICTTSGASIALQLMKVISSDPSNTTRLHVLYCHPTATDIPFKKSFFDPYQANTRGRIVVKYNVLSTAKQSSIDPMRKGIDIFSGHIDPSIVEATMPPPLCSYDNREEDRDGTDRSNYRPPILVCAPQSMLGYLCGHVSPIGNRTYWQGPFYRYTGFMKDMGYTRGQVYKFGVSTHFLSYK